MIHTLVVVAVLSAGAGDRVPPARPKTAPKTKPAPKPTPPPPPAEDEPDENAYPDAPDPDDEPEIGPTTPPPAADEDNPFQKGRRDGSDFTEEQLQALGGAVLCTCFCFVVGLIGLVVFLVRRGSRPKPGAPSVPPAGAGAGAAAPPPARTVPFHLSVLAVGMHSGARSQVAQQLILAGVQADPASAPERTQLVRELARAVRGLETEWTHFGYGERLDLADEAAAQRSYQLAVDDFTKRSGDASISGDATYVVLTLVLCTRRQLHGVSALDDRAQIRVLLDERATLLESDLMGAFIVWSSPIGGHEVLTRFPEMHAVR